MNKIDTNKINVEAMAKALDAEPSQIKLAINGPRQNVEQQSIEAIQTIEQARKLFNQARSSHRKNAIALRGLELCTDIFQLMALWSTVRSCPDKQVNFDERFSNKYREFYTARLPDMSIAELLSDVFICKDFDSEELQCMCDDELLKRCDSDPNGFHIAIRASDRFDCDQNPFLLKVAELADAQQARAVLENRLAGLRYDLDPSLTAVQILVQKASVLFPKK